ncbi:hypothetical protein Anapl_16969 [Anas platyrhynchos]|uniref:Uncharacterized protein n=1 Tax=Anas platyrhynchos TaxID=8839 RepID=R0LRM0_ANAPL|nr:hypothetical protein Anapl_16969 [Anas platyrhynchos]
MGLLICLTLIAVTSLHDGELKETVNDKRQMKSFSCDKLYSVDANLTCFKMESKSEECMFYLCRNMGKEKTVEMRTSTVNLSVTIRLAWYITNTERKHLSKLKASNSLMREAFNRDRTLITMAFNYSIIDYNKYGKTKEGILMSLKAMVLPPDGPLITSWAQSQDVWLQLALCFDPAPYFRLQSPSHPTTTNMHCQQLSFNFSIPAESSGKSGPATCKTMSQVHTWYNSPIPYSVSTVPGTALARAKGIFFVAHVKLSTKGKGRSVEGMERNPCAYTSRSGSIPFIAVAEQFPPRFREKGGPQCPKSGMAVGAGSSAGVACSSIGTLSLNMGNEEDWCGEKKNFQYQTQPVYKAMPNWKLAGFTSNFAGNAQTGRDKEPSRSLKGEAAAADHGERCTLAATSC